MITYVNLGACFVTSAATLPSLPFFLSFFEAAAARVSNAFQVNGVPAFETIGCFTAESSSARLQVKLVAKELEATYRA